MKVGMVEYLNALPLYFDHPPPQDFTFTFASPAQLNMMLRNGELDVALTSCTEYLDGHYQLLPGFCIAAHREIMSVNLYHQGSLNGATIGVTPHSAAAFSLLKVLCHHFWKVAPQFVPLEKRRSYDGFLLIGDEALQKIDMPGFQTIDLARAWYESTQLPFVFAIFSAQPHVNLSSLRQYLERAVSTSTEAVEQEAQKRSGLPLDHVRRYYELCHYRLGQRELEGLEKFKELREHVSLVLT